MYSVLFLHLAVSYIIVYEKAFVVPEMFHEAVSMISHRLRRRRLRYGATLYCKENRFLEKEFQSVRKAGVTVGDFHTLERTSTPVFVDFVLRNVVNMLVICG